MRKKLKEEKLCLHFLAVCDNTNNTCLKLPKVGIVAAAVSIYLGISYTTPPNHVGYIVILAFNKFDIRGQIILSIAV